MLKKSPKSYTTSVILAGIFGVVGIHHFYVERWGMAFFDFGLFVCSLTLYLTGNFAFALPLIILDAVHTVVVTYFLLTGQYKDGNGCIIAYPGQKNIEE